MAKKYKLVIVEDESALLEALTMVLQIDFEVVGAETGPAGLKAVKKHKPDLVLLDLFLPAMNGYEVLDSIKADDSVKDIPVVILSNCAGDADKKKAAKLGAMDFWVKADLDLEQIGEKVQDALAA